MYNLFNYTTQLRLSALFLQKEYQSYLWSQRTGSDTNVSLAQWMTNHVLNAMPGLTNAVQQINSDVSNNAILYKMASLLTNSVATNGAQRRSEERRVGKEC